MTRSHRLAAAILALAATLFAPFALALHACAMNAPESHSMAAMQGPDQAPATDMALCERHCNEGKVSLQTLANPPFPIAIAVIPPLRVDALEPLPVGAPAFDSPFAAAAGPAPPLIRYTVLRL